MTLKVVAVLLAKVREKRVTSAAGESEIVILSKPGAQVQLHTNCSVYGLELHFMLTFTHRLIFIAGQSSSIGQY